MALTQTNRNQVEAFGADGGGNLLALRGDREPRAVWYLPGALIEDETYLPTRGGVRKIAHTIDEFFEKLIDDVSAFVDGTPDHNS